MTAFGNIRRGAEAAMAAAASDIVSPVGIIAGAGTMPFAVADQLAARGLGAVIFALRGACDPVAVARYRHHWVSVGQVGKATRLFRSEGCRDLIFIGGLARPSLSEIRLDWGTLRVMGSWPRRFAAATTICCRGRPHLRAGRLSHDRRQGRRTRPPDAPRLHHAHDAGRCGGGRYRAGTGRAGRAWPVRHRPGRRRGRRSCGGRRGHRGHRRVAVTGGKAARRGTHPRARPAAACW